LHSSNSGPILAPVAQRFKSALLARRIMMRTIHKLPRRHPHLADNAGSSPCSILIVGKLPASTAGPLSDVPIHSVRPPRIQRQHESLLSPSRFLNCFNVPSSSNPARAQQPNQSAPSADSTIAHIGETTVLCPRTRLVCPLRSGANRPLSNPHLTLFPSYKATAAL